MAPGSFLPGGSRTGGAAPYRPPRQRHPAHMCRAGRGWGTYPPSPRTPWRVPAAPAVVLSEAGGCVREARPRMRAVGGAGITHPGGSRIGGAAPYRPPQKRHPALPCRVGRGWGTCPPSPRPPGGCRRHSLSSWQRLRGMWPWGAAGDEGGGWRRDYPSRRKPDRGRCPLSTPAETALGTGVPGNSVGGGRCPPHPLARGGEYVRRPRLPKHREAAPEPTWGLLSAMIPRHRRATSSPAAPIPVEGV